MYAKHWDSNNCVAAGPQAFTYDSSRLKQALFGDDFNRADRLVVRGRSEIDLEFALRGRFNVRKSFYQRPGTGFLGNVQALQQHGPITQAVKSAAANPPHPPAFHSEPPLHAQAR